MISSLPPRYLKLDIWPLFSAVTIAPKANNLPLGYIDQGVIKVFDERYLCSDFEMQGLWRHAVLENILTLATVTSLKYPFETIQGSEPLFIGRLHPVPERESVAFNHHHDTTIGDEERLQFGGTQA